MRVVAATSNHHGDANRHGTILMAITQIVAIEGALEVLAVDGERDDTAALVGKDTFDDAREAGASTECLHRPELIRANGKRTEGFCFFRVLLLLCLTNLIHTT